MRLSLLIPILLLLVACGRESSESSILPDRPLAGKALPLIEDNVAHDTLLIHETVDLQDGTFIMSARNVDETFEGLRLFHYRIGQDDQAEIISYSTPAYDSWMMRPNFFPNPAGGYLILAEYGYIDSWGQKAFLFDERGFQDIGFMEAAYLPNDVERDAASTNLGVKSIAPFVDVAFSQNGPVISFNSESIFLYDDGQGHLDTLYEAAMVSYSMQEGKLDLIIEQ